MSLDWKRREGRSSVYYTAETPAGRIRITRVNRRGVAAFKVSYPDGRHIHQDTIDDAKAVAEAQARTLLVAHNRAGK